MAPKVKASAKKYGTRKAEASINKTTAGAVAKKTAWKTTGKKPPARAAGSRGATAGPEALAGAARDTAVVLRSLFEKARESVILAGYSFDHAEDVLSPLYAAMRDHGVSAAFFVDIPQIERHVDADAHVARAFKRFLAESWPFGEPRPRLFFDKRALKPGPPWCSIHAKCVVVDGASAFVSSANFTQRGQERNIEVGVLIDDASFASYLAGQWLGLIEVGLVGEYKVG